MNLKFEKTFAFAEDYRQFLSECKTEREVVFWITNCLTTIRCQGIFTDNVFKDS